MLAEIIEGVSTTPCDCADHVSRGAGGTCAPAEALQVVREYALQHKKGGEQDDAKPANDLPVALQQVGAVLHCTTEACILAHPQVTKFATTRGKSQVLTRVLQEYFKPTGPRDSADWLSDRDVDSALAGWTRAFPRFYHCPYAMMDFDKQETPFATVRLADVIHTMDTFGAIINTDVSTGPGEHWVAAFIDMRQPLCTVEYFDSVGAPPPKPIVAWMERRCEELRALGRTAEACVAANKQHQRSNTECGMYSLYYIRCRLEGQPVGMFAVGTVPDARMKAFRKHVFRTK